MCVVSNFIGDTLALRHFM